MFICLMARNNLGLISLLRHQRAPPLRLINIDIDPRSRTLALGHRRAGVIMTPININQCRWRGVNCVSSCRRARSAEDADTNYDKLKSNT
jgi:hypothetical protein